MSADTVATLKIIAEIILGWGGLGGLAAVVGQWFARRKYNAEAKKTEEETEQEVPANAANTLAKASAEITKQYQTLLTDYQRTTDEKIRDLKTDVLAAESKISGLERTVERYGKRITYLMTGIQILTHQIIESGDSPCFTPDEWRPEFDRKNNDEKQDPGNVKG